MTGDEIAIGSVRAQVNRLMDVLLQMELDLRWKEHSAHYASRIQDVEKSLKKIRKMDLGYHIGRAEIYLTDKPKTKEK